MTDAIIPKERSAYNRSEAKKSVVGLYYLMAGLRNKFVNQHKLEVGLYLRASGAMWEAIDTMLSLRYSACTKTVDAYQKKIQKEHSTKIENYFLEHNNFHVYNIADYHSIYENRRPDMVSCSTANYFATCVAKPILGCSSEPLVFNGVSVHNPENVEAPRICWYLLHRYTGIFDISYSDYMESQDRLVRFKEQDLHSVQDYTNVLNLILSINNKTYHLDGRVAPIIVDWPGQIFIRKALHMQTLPKFQSLFPQQIESFLPILGPLHVSLNSREQVIMVYHSFFEKLFHYVFGKNKVLALKLRPWRINLLLELMRNGWIKIKDKIIKKFGRVCKDVDDDFPYLVVRFALEAKELQQSASCIPI
ncbi:hypothetical protein C2G38_2214832 [Gigaspora rosea]|uniref:Uncharacterized protein n=1 Tax=Gigaspora rosea TaxID=44941 RepID=A0A397UCE0_9GLOM|nr:hypothetical protein C2G38_2214832 [Gigaspora rosea]